MQPNRKNEGREVGEEGNGESQRGTQCGTDIDINTQKKKESTLGRKSGGWRVEK